MLKKVSHPQILLIALTPIKKKTRLHLIHHIMLPTCHRKSPILGEPNNLKQNFNSQHMLEFDGRLNFDHFID